MATSKVDPVPLVGGPLDGQTYRPVSRWPAYLDESAKPVLASKGDRIIIGRDRYAKGVYRSVKPGATPTAYQWRVAQP
jgi:hypothetical protein